MQKVNVEIEAYTYRELVNTGAHVKVKAEMRRLFAKDTLEKLADHVISVTEEQCQKILNTEIEVTIAVGPVGSFDVNVFIGKVGSQKLPYSSRLNNCPHMIEAIEHVEDIQLYSKVLKNLERKNEHEPVRFGISDLIDTRTRELTYEITAAVTADFGEDMDQIHSDQWVETMAVQGGLLFTKEGKVIEGAIDYSQLTIGA